MAVQQRRVNKSRKGMRRSHHALKKLQLPSVKNMGVLFNHIKFAPIVVITKVAR